MLLSKLHEKWKKKVSLEKVKHVYMNCWKNHGDDDDNDFDGDDDNSERGGGSQHLLSVYSALGTTSNLFNKYCLIFTIMPWGCTIIISPIFRI